MFMLPKLGQDSLCRDRDGEHDVAAAPIPVRRLPPPALTLLAAQRRPQCRARFSIATSASLLNAPSCCSLLAAGAAAELARTAARNPTMRPGVRAAPLHC